MKKDLYEKWKNHVIDELHDLEHIKPTKVKSKCPKCLSSSLEYDPENGKVTCSKCGYSEYIAKVMR